MLFRGISESEWLNDPLWCLDMSDFHTDYRRLRLFGAACCRCRFHDILEDRQVKILDLVDQYSDRTIKINELQQAVENEIQEYSVEDPTFTNLKHQVIRAIKQLSQLDDHIMHPGFIVSRDIRNIDQTYRNIENNIQANLLHDIFGNPFRPVTFDLAWLTPTVKRFAQTAYDDRTFDLLPILADALEEAGCDNADVLDHCRTYPVHVRGCWVVDSILGIKESENKLERK